MQENKWHLLQHVAVREAYCTFELNRKMSALEHRVNTKFFGKLKIYSLFRKVYAECLSQVFIHLKYSKKVYKRLLAIRALVDLAY